MFPRPEDVWRARNSYDPHSSLAASVAQAVRVAHLQAKLKNLTARPGPSTRNRHWQSASARRPIALYFSDLGAIGEGARSEAGYPFVSGGAETPTRPEPTFQSRAAHYEPRTQDWSLEPTLLNPRYLHRGGWKSDEDIELTLTANRASQKHIRQYEREVGPWPKTPEGRNFDVAHKKALADGGADTFDNIEPLHPQAHREQHISNGDLARWGKRPWIARTFGGTVAKGMGIFSILPGILGVLSGRVRTDNFDNFSSDMVGMPSQEDVRRQLEEERKRLAPNSKPGTIVG